MRRSVVFWVKRVLLIGGIVGLSSCDAEELTQVVVLLETDFDVPESLASVRFVAESSTETKVNEVDLGGTDAPGFPLSLTYVPSGATDAPLSVTVTGFDDSGAALVTQTRVTAFLPGKSVALTMELSRLCASETCPEGQTCVPSVNGSSEDRGVCVSAERAPEMLSPFAAGQVVSRDELCNTRDEDGDGAADAEFNIGANPKHCQGCFDSCDVPEGANGEPTCTDGECGIRCAAGFRNCNGDDADGCEVLLGDGLNCSDCGDECVDGAPFCQPEGTGFGCKTNCDPGFTQCGTSSCADLMVDPRFCGACETSCPPTTRGTPACSAGECIPECDQGAHACGEVCEPNDAVATCGQRCDAGCDAGDTCLREECWTCSDFRLDCDGAEACESRIDSREGRPGATSRLNCGGTCTQCGAGECVAGICQVTVIDFEVGPRHVCAELSDNTFWCWGANEAGQAGQPLSPFVLSPTRLGFEDPAPEMGLAALDDRATYFREIQGGGEFVPDMVTLIGENPISSTTAVPASPVQVSQGAPAVSGGAGISIHYQSGLKLYGWGENRSNVFTSLCPLPGGCSRIGQRQLAASTAGSTRRHRYMLARGVHETCAAFFGAEGELVCWGQADDPMAQVFLGNGNTNGSLEPIPIAPPGMVFRTVPNFGTRATDYGVVIGTRAACATFSESADSREIRTHCWGDWDCGPYDLSPQPVPGDRGLVGRTTSLTVGASSACALFNGEMICWGRDLEGGACREEPSVVMPDFAGIVKVRLSANFGCFLLGATGPDVRRYGQSGNLYCWGANDSGQLGVGDSHPTETFEARQVVFGTPP